MMFEENIGQWLIRFAMSVLEIFRYLWGMLNSSITIGKIDILGWTIFEGIIFTPLQATPYVAGVILTVALISLFIPS